MSGKTLKRVEERMKVDETLCTLLKGMANSTITLTKSVERSNLLDPMDLTSLSVLPVRESKEGSDSQAV